jgi:hypothetical protein
MLQTVVAADGGGTGSADGGGFGEPGAGSCVGGSLVGAGTGLGCGFFGVCGFCFLPMTFFLCSRFAALTALR